MEHEVVIKKKVTDDDLICVLSGSLTGCAYWCNEIDYNQDEYSEAKINLIREKKLNASEVCYEDVLLQMLKEGKKVSYYDVEEEEYKDLTLDKLLQAIGKHIASGNATDTDMDCWDDTDYDSVIQYALYDDVIYG